MNQRFSFHQGWKFVPDFLPPAIDPAYPTEELASWADVTLPHTLRVEPYRNGTIPTRQGLGMYRKHFPVEESLRGRQLFLEFEAVMGVTDVWLNGVPLHTKFADLSPDPDGTVHTNAGGYLPFVVELTPCLHFGGDNVLVVLTDNRDNGQVPPGKPQSLLDFTYFGGIYRSVWLDVYEPVHITNPLFEDVVQGGGVVFDILSLSQEAAQVQIRTHVRNNADQDQPLRLTAALDKHKVSTEFLLRGGDDITVPLTLTVPKPRLWSPDAPNRYTLTCTLYRGDKILHVHSEQVGLRQIEVSREKGLFLNGRRLPLLSGVNRHQDFPLLGNATPASLQRGDAILYKSAGFNVVRAAHYPMSVDFLDACDELGILLIEATPGWQWYPVGEDVPFTQRVHQNIRQMVRRDRNHPCILAYETVLNETYHIPRGYTRRMEEIALEESRDARVAAESYGYDVSVNGVDDLASFIYGFQDPLAKTEKALQFHREYGDSWQEAYGHRMSRRVTRGNCASEYPGGSLENLCKANNLLFEHRDDIYTLADCLKAYQESPAFAGGAIWTGIDSRGMWSRISPCGIWDPFRLPKTACYALASQRSPERRPDLEHLGVETGPLIHIARDGSDVYVYSNAAAVELRSQSGSEITYQKRQTPMTEGLCAYLPHAPYLFRDVPSGDLTAVGYDPAGRVLAQSQLRTPGKPRRIILETPQRRFLADGSDVLPVYAKIVDENGILCPDAEPSVHITLEGDGQLVGESCFAAANPTPAEAGIAAFYVRAGTTEGSLFLCAESAGLERGALVLNLTAPAVSDFPFTPTPRGKPDSDDLADKLISGGQVLTRRHQGVVYPKSVVIKERALFRPGKAYTRLYGRVSMRKGGTVKIFADGAVIASLTRSAPFRVNLPAGVELAFEAPAGTVLLSPYLSDEPLAIQDTRVNLAVKCRCTASSHPADAGNVMKKGRLWETMWVGAPIGEAPEYFQLDLGRAWDIQDAMVYIGGQMGSDCTNYTYEIHTSPDGEAWTCRVKTRRTSWSNGVLDRFEAPGVRYVQVVFTNVDGGLLPALSKIHIYQKEGE